MSRLVETSLNAKKSPTTPRGMDRAAEILTTARALIATQGYAGFSMRSLAQQLGMSLSNLQHYYPSKEALMEGVIQFALGRYQQGVDQALGSHAGDSRLAQLTAVIDFLIADIARRDARGLLLELWALAHREPFAARALAQFQARAGKVLSGLVQALAPHDAAADCKRRARLMLAAIQGMATTTYPDDAARAAAADDFRALLVALALAAPARPSPAAAPRR